MNAFPTTDIRAEIAQRRQKEARERRDRVRLLTESDRRAETARSLFGTTNQPEDRGADGIAAVMRERIVEDTDGEHRSSSARRGAVQKRVRIQCETHIEWLCVRKVITQDQMTTGMRFRGAWLASRHSSRVAALYGERFGHSSGGMTESEYRTDMRSLVDRMLGVLSPRQQAVVKGMCGEDQTAVVVSPNRDSRLVQRTLDELRTGLDAIGAEMRRRR